MLLAAFLVEPYLERAEPVIFLGDTGTGKTHLMTALCVEACREYKRVRFTTVAALINELVEASHNSQLSSALARWKKWDLIALDERSSILWQKSEPSCGGTTGHCRSGREG
jgi:DNA replication protein DnaC